MWQVKNGASIKIWEDKWVPNEDTGQQPTSTPDPVPQRVSDLITQDENWDQDKLDNLFTPDNK